MKPVSGAVLLSFLALCVPASYGATAGQPPAAAPAPAEHSTHAPEIAMSATSCPTVLRSCSMRITNSP